MRGAVLLILSLAMCALTPILASGNVMDVNPDSRLDYLDGSGAVSYTHLTLPTKA